MSQHYWLLGCHPRFKEHHRWFVWARPIILVMWQEKCAKSTLLLQSTDTQAISGIVWGELVLFSFFHPMSVLTKKLLALNLWYIVYPPQGYNYHNYIIWLLTMATDCGSRAQEVWCDILAMIGGTEKTWTQGREKIKETRSSAVYLQALRRTSLLSHRRCCSSPPWPGHNPWSPHTLHYLNKA